MQVIAAVAVDTGEVVVPGRGLPADVGRGLGPGTADVVVAARRAPPALPPGAGRAAALAQASTACTKSLHTPRRRLPPTLLSCPRPHPLLSCPPRSLVRCTIPD